MHLLKERTDYLRPFCIKGNLNIDEIPVEYIIKEALQYGHKIIDGYIYGIKGVSQENQDMFKINTLEAGKIYKYVDVDRNSPRYSHYSEFSYYGEHTAGLWSFRCDLPSFIKEKKLNEFSVLNKYILVKYRITDIIPIGNLIKGREMEVISTKDITEDDPIFHNCLL